MIRNTDEAVGIEAVHLLKAGKASWAIATPCACVFFNNRTTHGDEAEHLIFALSTGYLIFIGIAVHLGDGELKRVDPIDIDGLKRQVNNANLAENGIYGLV